MKKTLLLAITILGIFALDSSAQLPVPAAAATPAPPSPVALATPSPVPQLAVATAQLSAASLQIALTSVPVAPLSLQTLLGRLVTLPAGVTWSQVRTVRVDIPPNGGPASIRVTYSH